MEVLTKHFGPIQMRVIEDIPVIIYKVAPLKYYHPDRDPENKDDKDKADVVFAWKGEWKMAGYFSVDTYEGKEDEIRQAIIEA